MSTLDIECNLRCWIWTNEGLVEANRRRRRDCFLICRHTDVKLCIVLDSFSPRYLTALGIIPRNLNFSLVHLLLVNENGFVLKLSVSFYGWKVKVEKERSSLNELFRDLDFCHMTGPIFAESTFIQHLAWTNALKEYFWRSSDCRKLEIRDCLIKTAGLT